MPNFLGLVNISTSSDSHCLRITVALSPMATWAVYNRVSLSQTICLRPLEQFWNNKLGKRAANVGVDTSTSH